MQSLLYRELGFSKTHTANAAVDVLGYDSSSDVIALMENGKVSHYNL
jgi:hypothetical protein